MHVKPSTPLFLLTACGRPVGRGAGAAAFIEDSHLSLDARNFYMNRDYRDADKADTPKHKGAAKNKAEDWGRASCCASSPGFTEGPVGFGVDALGLLGIKLDSGGGTSGTGALLRNPKTGDAADEFSFVGPTAKARVAQSVLTVGTPHAAAAGGLSATTPACCRRPSRAPSWCPRTSSKLTLTAGQFRSTRLRDSTDYQDMTMFADGARGGVQASDRFNYAGASYAAAGQPDRHLFLCRAGRQLPPALRQPAVQPAAERQR